MRRAEAIRVGVPDTVTPTDLVHNFRCAAALLQVGPDVRYIAFNDAFAATIGFSGSMHPIPITALEPTFEMAECVTHAVSTGMSERTVWLPNGGCQREFAVLPLVSGSNIAHALLVETKGSPQDPEKPVNQAQVLDQLSPLGDGFIYVYDVELNRTIYANDHMLTLLDLKEGQPVDLETLIERTHPDDKHKFIQHVISFNFLKDRDVARLEFRMRDTRGQWRWVDNHVRVCRRRADGTTWRVVGLAADVTERRELTQTLANTVQSLTHAEEIERQRIARELHDSTAQHLVAIDLAIGSLERRLQPDIDDEAQLLIADLRSSLAAAHREIRTFSYLLHPPELERRGLEETVRQFVHGFELRTGLVLTVAVEGDISDLGNDRELALFRVLQESLMNVHRHAEAKSVRITLRRDEGAVTLDVQDDGHGLLPDTRVAPQPGVGIAGMRARIARLGGRLSLFSSGAGFRVRARVPMGRPPHED
jgi:signal transduction histidine kinase